MNHDLRIATLEDRSVIEAIVKAAYARYVPRIGREPGPMRDDYGAFIRDGCVHVLDHGGAIQGILVLIPEADALLLDNVAVPPEAQGLGFGRAMLAFAERAARDAGYRSIRLYTNEAMTENCRRVTIAERPVWWLSYPRGGQGGRSSGESGFTHIPGCAGHMGNVG